MEYFLGTVAFGGLMLYARQFTELTLRQQGRVWNVEFGERAVVWYTRLVRFISLCGLSLIVYSMLSE